tara:strand:+ start:2824 stop:5682 length:2859 start_codon:yes stop_codon:yes gene_type:complete
MANETIVSPGVFTRENDQSFLPQGIGQIGAAIVGPTQQGPAFVPVVIRNGFSEFQRRFGDLSPHTYIPQTVREYLRSAGSVTVCRVLAGGGYKFDGTNKQVIALVASSSAGSSVGIKAKGAANLANAASDNQEFRFEAGSNIFRFIASDPVGAGVPDDDTDGQVFFFTTGANAASSSANLAKEINDNASSILSASANGAQLQLTSSVIGTGANGFLFKTGSSTTSFSSNNSTLITLAGGVGSTAISGHGEILTVFFPSKNTSDALALELGNSILSPEGESLSGSFSLTLSGSGAGSTGKKVSASLVTTANDYIEQVLGVRGNSNNSKIGANAYEFSAFPRLNFKQRQLSLVSNQGVNLSLVSNTGNLEFTSSFSEGYSQASTPFITSQLDVAKNVTNLFKFHTLADGTDTNTKYKVSISNLKEPSNINGEEQYSQFSVTLRAFSDDDKNQSILEQFNNCNLDPNDVNYISRKIGDRYAQYNDVLGKVELKGNYPNTSQYVRVEVTSQVEEGALSPKLSPYGFRAINDTITGFSLGDITCFLPSASFKTQHIDNNSNFNISSYLGWDFSQTTDNINWIGPVPKSAPSNISGDFNVGKFSVHPSASISFLGSLSASLDTTGEAGPTNTFIKFSVPFQGGSDGINPTIVPQVGEYIEDSNLYGFDLSGTNKAGYKGYKKALDILSNQDEYDINMLALPGVIKTLHPSVTNAAIDMVEARSDAFYVMDLNQVNDPINTAVNATDGLDTNYAAAYYPWVKVLDTSRNKPIFVPPSVVVPGAIAASDALQAEWFAPAGLTRGVLGNVLEARIRLNQAERDSLYEASINPIATFPQTGICIWGQKTLQLKSSALDRINVRRLLIAVKKFIGSSSRYLLFEQNTAATRNRFLNIVNPYLESIQSRQGLFAFRVQMDENNNTADVIDRNQLVGAIYLQPTKTAEFIILDFNVLPTGATFGE